MAEAGGRLWLSQAASDRWAAHRLNDPAHSSSRCQVVAKCQQTVEKSVKAIAAGFRDRFDFDAAIGYGHEVGRLASAPRRPAQRDDPTDVRHRVNRLLTEYTIAEINALELLIPRRPAPGQLHARNTEYPFERLAGDWTTPALDGFTANQVRRHLDLADRVYTGASGIVSVLRR